MLLIHFHYFYFLFSSLPSLRPLLDVYYLPLTNMRIARTFCFTNNGQALYLVSPTEIQRITYSQETCENLQVQYFCISLLKNQTLKNILLNPKVLNEQNPRLKRCKISFICLILTWWWKKGHLL